VQHTRATLADGCGPSTLGRVRGRGSHRSMQQAAGIQQCTASQQDMIDRRTQHTACSRQQGGHGRSCCSHLAVNNFFSSLVNRPCKPHKRHGHRYAGLTSQRLAKSMKGIMVAAGVPADFMSHSARHAGIALRKEGASTLDSLDRLRPFLLSN
jgi:hypothetical protein